MSSTYYLQIESVHNEPDEKTNERLKKLGDKVISVHTVAFSEDNSMTEIVYKVYKELVERGD